MTKLEYKYYASQEQSIEEWIEETNKKESAEND